MNRVATPIVAFEPAPVSVTPEPRVSVVIVIYRTGDSLGESLTRVLAEPLVDELVVVDNGSTAAEATLVADLAQSDPRLKRLCGQGNVGFARGANLGARHARGGLLVFLNPDAFLQAGCIAQLAAAIAERPVPSLVGGRVMNPDGTEQRGARRGDITPMSALMSLSGLAGAAPALQRYEVHWEAEQTPETVIPVPTISGACFCMRRADFDAVGGFDEGFFLHVEDVDLCWRVREAGGQVLFQPKAEVVHLGHTSQVSPLRVEFHKGVGLARYFRKRATGFSQQLVAWLISPLVVGAAIARPLMWRLTGRT